MSLPFRLQMEAKTKSDTSDLGYMLHRFLKRYGPQYDAWSVAVAVKQGGVVQRHVVPYDTFKNPDRIAVVDPLTGAGELRKG